MFLHTSIVLHVRDLSRSLALYEGLMGVAPERLSPTFASMPLPSGGILEFWQRDAVDPAPASEPGGFDLTFSVADADTLERLHAAWREAGLAVLLPPSDRIFGRTVVMADPDGHRLRINAPARAS
jgi:catechol 2,3-dioxygenase-like lactoylglutathione lyase family enzyme